MSPIDVGVVVATGVGLVILHRATVWEIRKRCGIAWAETLALAMNTAAFSSLVIVVASRSPIAMVVGLVAMIGANFVPALLIRVTGGADEICFLRRAIRDLVGSIGTEPLSPERVAELRAQLRQLNRFNSSLAEPVVEAVQTAVGLVLSGTPDRASIHRAYDVVDERLAALRAQHPW